jgi:hypothetical protein
LKLKPDEFWNLTYAELNEMLEYYLEEEKLVIEREQYLVAWQTALLMNATGNYKRTITPEKLLGKNKNKSPEVKEIDREEKEKKLQELMSKFGYASPSK